MTEARGQDCEARSRLVSRDPATGAVESVIARFDDEALERALQRGVAAQSEWSRRPIAERAHALRQVAQAFEDRREELAALATREMGKRLVEARAEIDKCVAALRYYGEHGESILADRTVPTGARSARIVMQPLGLILLVMPWNFPFWQVVRQAMVVTLAGNAALLKHASNVPGCGVALESLFAAGLPPDVFQFLPVGADAVETIIKDERVHGVSLTGSEGAGAAVGRAAGSALKPVVLELGGSDPFIVLDDADLDAVVAKAVKARIQNNGETCIAAKRFLIQRSLYEPFVERLAAAFAALKVGLPLEAETELGPLARADLVDELLDQIERSVLAGARLVTGGRRLEGHATPCFMSPAVLSNVRPGMAVFDEETFGPCAAVTAFDDDDEAAELANASRYGLGGSVWSADLARAEAVARRLECGSAFVNAIVASDPRYPFGGVKASGHGRELGEWGPLAFVNVKSLVVESAS